MQVFNTFLLLVAIVSVLLLGFSLGRYDGYRDCLRTVERITNEIWKDKEEDANEKNED